VWVERDGRVQEIDPTWRGRGNPTQSSLALSPDGTRLAISLGDLGGRYDLWVKQLDTGPALKLTSEGTFNRRASWSQDGQSLFFMSDRAGEFDLWTQRADGSSMAELVLSIDEQIYEAHYSSDGTWLVFRVEADNIYAIRSVDTVRVPLVETGFQDRYIAVSPDGRWLAYVSDDRGQEEVYVRPFPDATSALVPVSAAGGTEPVWSHSGRELFYRNGANEMMVAQVTLEPTFAVGRQEMLFSAADYLSANGHRQYDVSPDDQRFTMLRIGDEDVGAELVLVQNFFEELKRLVPN
jgi:protease II